jgi:hypothetical protein
MKLIVFIALILLLGPISMNACIDDGLCRGARLCSKEFFSSAVLSSHYVYIYIYVCTVITFSIKPTMPSKKRIRRRRGEEKK